jgi:hypothetical protein
MITSITGSKLLLKQALNQGRLVRVEKCFSGVLGSEPLYRRIALTTGPAFTALEMNPTLKNGLLAEITANGTVSDRSFQSSTGFNFVLYNNRTFGLMLDGSAEESGNFQKAEDAVQGRFYRSGQNRRILLATWGISAPAEVDLLPAKDFQAIIVKMTTVAQDPHLFRTTAVELTDTPFDSTRTLGDGSLLLSLSRAGLAKEELIPRTLLGSRPLKPTNAELFLGSIHKVWVKLFGY